MTIQKHFREVFYYKDYYLNFFNSQGPEVQAKFNWTLNLIASLDRVPKKYFLHIENTVGIYEIRVQLGNDIFRIFAFFDKGKLIIIANAFQKKSQKTPRKEIELAQKIKNEYFNETDK